MVFFGAFCVLCCAAGSCCLLYRVSGPFVWLRCLRWGLLSGLGLRCRVLCCALLCPWVRCCAALLRVVQPVVVLLCAVLSCFAPLVPLLAVSCPQVLSVALGFCVFRRCFLWCFPASCALCCVCFAVVCWCLLLFAAVLCAVCVLGCRAVRSVSPLLGAVLFCAVLVRLRCAVGVVCAVAGAWCYGGLLCVVLFPLVLCGSRCLRLSSGGVFRCRCPCLGAWPAFLWLLCFAVVPSSPVLCSVVLCCCVVPCCRALLSFCVALCAVLSPLAFCGAVVLPCCVVWCAVVSCCAVLCSVVLCCLVVPRCRAVLCFFCCCVWLLPPFLLYTTAGLLRL